VLRKEIPYRKRSGRLYFVKAEIESWIEDAPGLTINDFEKKE
jgi:hypothetical protein